MSQTRSFLFLQGVCSPFFARLADSLQGEGHRVFKIHFNAGDWLYWAGRSSWNYRGSLARLGDFLEDRYRTLGITDQVLFGDCRPVHRPATAHAKTHGVRTHVFEEGYFRPYWVTLERDGVNGYSHLPRDPGWFKKVGACLPDYGDGQPFPSPFTIRALHDVLYHAAGCCNPLFFRNYRAHAPVNAAVEYLGYVRRLPLLSLHRHRDDALINQEIVANTPFFILPLQLEGDAQIRSHSQFPDMAAVVEHVMESFVRHAPAPAKLLIKNHPLDPGLVDYTRIIRRLTDRFGLAGRVHYLETGNLEVLLRHARGTVTVNSTVGALALELHCPTMTLSNPIYNLPGLTFQGPLDVFWNEEYKPDRSLFRYFRNTVIHATQVNGGFYSRQGIALLVNNCRRALTGERAPLEELL